MILKEFASQRGLTASAARAQHYSMASSSSSSYSGTPRGSSAYTPSQGYDSAVMDFLSDIGHDQEEREAEFVLSRLRCVNTFFE